MIINSITEFCVQYDAALGLLRVSWEANSNMRHFQRAFTQLHGLVNRLLVPCVVLELNAMPDISVYDQLWLSTHFMPALGQLSLRQVVVVLSGRRIYNQHVVEGLLAAMADAIEFDVQFFTRSEAALAWLTDDSPRLPALLTEWAAHCDHYATQPDEVAEPQAPYNL